MHKNYLKSLLLLVVAGFQLTIAEASTPVWTFAPVAGFPGSAIVSTTGQVTIKYTVMNHSHKVHTLQMKPISGITPTGCTLPLGYNQSCLLTLVVNGSALQGDVFGGPVLCAELNPNQCYQPSQANGLAIRLTPTPPATLTRSVLTLALSINCQPASTCTTTQNAALTGNSRQITITNTGSINANNVSVSTANLPSGTVIGSNTCSGTLNAGDSCIITLTPGSAASTGCTSGTEPVAGTVTVSADGGLSSETDVYVLGYGCQYQGGFIYAVDDTTPNTGSIGGKVAALVDQAAPSITSGPQSTSILWSSNGDGINVDNTTILGIDEISTTLAPSPTSPPYPVGTPAYTACNGSSDGACDSSNILSYYNFNRVSGGGAPTPLNYYAAGLCTATINSYSDWYLPAICEMDGINTNITCPTGTQSMVVGLSFLIGDPSVATPSTSCNPPSGIDCLAGLYWSSTELYVDPQFIAWYEFVSINGSIQVDTAKFNLLGVRCTRALTP